LTHPNGKVDAYKKMFLPNFGPFEEKIFFSQGQSLSIFETDFGKIGLCICYDLFFPEIVKSYALRGADLVVCISASPSITRKFFEAILPARAIENTIFVAYANLVGTQEDLVFWGGGQVYGPKGDLLVKAPYFEESVVKCDLDFDELEDARTMRPTLRDTRAELFADLYDIVREREENGRT
jgi:predicted amidohydrolase